MILFITVTVICLFVGFINMGWVLAKNDTVDSATYLWYGVISFVMGAMTLGSIVWVVIK